jgi:uncharacterized membrane protein
MATISIKCPNCGGALELDDSKEFGFCIFCGTQVHIQDEKTRVEVSGSVKLDETDKYRNYLTLATRAFEARNMSEAYTYYTKALEIKQNDYLPVFRKALCAGYLSDDLGLRIEEVVSGVSMAYDMVSDQSIQKNMSDEIVTFALTDRLQVVTTFYSSDECSRYVQGVYNRVTLLNRLYPFLDKDNAESVSKYIEITISYCKQVSLKAMQFVAGTTVNKGKSKTVFGTYPVPQNIISDVAAISKRMSDEFNKYIRPKIEIVKSEISQINEQINALPQLLRISHIISSWWVLLIGVIMLAVLAPVGIVICVAWFAMLIVFKVKDKAKTASGLYKQLKAKKKELAQLNKQLKK